MPSSHQTTDLGARLSATTLRGHASDVTDYAHLDWSKARTYLRTSSATVGDADVRDGEFLLVDTSDATAKLVFKVGDDVWTFNSDTSVV